MSSTLSRPWRPASFALAPKAATTRSLLLPMVSTIPAMASSALHQCRTAWATRRQKRLDREMETMIRRLGHPGVLADFLGASGRPEGP